MKNPKKLTYVQKCLLEKEGYDPAEYYCTKHALGKYWFVHKKDLIKKHNDKSYKVKYVIICE